MSDQLKAAAWTALFTFTAVFGIGLLGWIADVAAWAGTDNAEFPSVTPLGKLVVAGLAAAASGFINWLVRLAQAKGVLPGHGPVYDTTARDITPPEFP